VYDRRRGLGIRGSGCGQQRPGGPGDKAVDQGPGDPVIKHTFLYYLNIL